VFSNAVELTINAIPVAPTVANGARCGAGSVTLAASGGSAGQYRWYTAATGGTPILGEPNSSYVTPSLTVTTTYFVSINNGCESFRTPVTATINPLPPIPTLTSNITVIGNAVTICSTTALTLSAPNGFASYNWSNGATTSQITATTSGNYSVTVTDASGCVSPASAAITVTVVPAPCTNSAPVINTTALSTTIGNSVSIDLATLISDADNNVVLSSLTILQQPASGAQASLNGTTLLINYSGNSFTGTDALTIRVCDVFGECTTQQLQINVIGEIEIFNAVSHNNDGKNDFFKIENIELLEPENKVIIYNRWGSQVFEVENYSQANAFRGLNQNGNELPSGTYFYKILIKSSGKTQTGYLVLK
jgi:gliding motility-associated-like protein